MSDGVSGRASFWREALHELKLFVKVEWQWVALFAALAAIKQLLMAANFDTNELVNRLKEAQGNYGQSIAVFNQFLPHIILSTLSDLTIAALATYTFTVLYLRQFAQATVPALTAANFFYWLGKVAQKYWKLSWPFLLGVLIYVGFDALKAADSVMNVVVFLLVLASMAWVFYFYYGLYLLYLVTPLAVLRRDDVMKTSSELTKVHLWRIWWGSVMVIVVLFIVFFIPLAANAWVTGQYGATSAPAQALSSIVQGAWRALAEVALAIYACTVYRILLQEQKNLSVSEKQ
jgi:hypothetical protein